MNAITRIRNSNGYALVKNAPRTGICDSPGIVILWETPSSNLSEAAPKTFRLMVFVRNEVSAMARMFTTTPLMT